MGLVSIGRAIAGIATRVFGGATVAAAPAAARGVSALRAVAPGLAGGLAGGAAFEGAARFFGDGGGGVPPVGRADLAIPGPQFVTLDDGSQVLVTGRGTVPRPQLFLPAGSKLPAGATIVSVSPDGNLFGIRRARKRRTFAGEIERCKTAVKAADSLITAVRKKK